MKKRRVLVDYTRPNGTETFLYLVNVCMKRGITFIAMSGLYNGRFECECDDEAWGVIESGCLDFCHYLLDYEGGA